MRKKFNFSDESKRMIRNHVEQEDPNNEMTICQLFENDSIFILCRDTEDLDKIPESLIDINWDFLDRNYK